MDLKDIKAIIDLMKKNSLTEFELEKQDFKVKLKRAGVAPMSLEDSDAANFSGGRPPVAFAGAPVIAAPPVVPASPVINAGESEIRSPMIGTFYRSPSPDSGSYVEVGSEVGPDTVVCIIEAMKVMNEIKAETRGVITSIVAENSKPVEFGQALFKIRPI